MPQSNLSEPEVTVELALKHGLSEEEFEMIKKRLGRLPSFTELGVYSVMWSEHCSYKNSILEIKKLPREGEHLLVETGEENAGLVDIGEGWGCAFKIESHNHPSAIEPYHGAATGVGGVVRDIFTMGARPVASLNSLRFGKAGSERVKELLKGAVNGIADYGNELGVPMIAGEVYFDECYEGNPLVNAMSIGLVRADETISAIAKGLGNPVMMAGARTSRAGVSGAAFASEEITEDRDSKGHNIPQGNPGLQKRLIEACLEVIKTGAVVGMQDMGAAGIACSSSEMTEKGGQGMLIDLDKVPVSEEGMSAYELLLSEAQERMLLVVEKGREQEVFEVYEKWDIEAVIIGEMVDTDRVTYTKGGQIKADLPAQHLVLGGGAPQYVREAVKPAYLDEVQNFDAGTLEEPADLEAAFKKVLSSPNIASRKWIYDQFKGASVSGPGATNAGIVRVEGTKKGLVSSVDCNSRYVYLNPRKGGAIAVAESARNVVCSGGKPLAISNCLNFGNPYKPEMYWTFKEALAGMGEACRVFNTPVTGGNVSFYNENKDGAVYPTPVIGMLGVIEDVDAHLTTPAFKNEKDIVIYLGAARKGLGGSEYLKVVHGLTSGDAPELDLDFERTLQNALLEAIQNGLITAAHDVSDGGLAVTLAEMAVFGAKGADISFDEFKGSKSEILFSEAQSGVVITVAPENLKRVEEHFGKFGVPALTLGTVSGKVLNLNSAVQLSVSDLDALYHKTIPALVEA